MNETFLNKVNNLSNQNKNPLTLFGIILALGMVVTGIIGSSAMVKIKSNNEVITVTGSSRVDVVSDNGKLYISFSRPAKVATLSNAYNEIKSDENAIIAYLKSQGFKDEEITTKAVQAEDVWDQAERARKDYTLRQNIEVMSSNVDLIDSVSKSITTLASKGIVLNISPSYTYSKLADERVSLLSSAIDDAKARAEAIASKSGRGIGKIQSASSGVVQVMSPGSIEVQDYGSYDTSTIAKTIMVTTKVSFTLK